MIFRKKHRVISEIEKRRLKGQITHFLTGDAIKGHDAFFYNIRYGIQNLAKTLMLYYFKDHGEFDYMIQVTNKADNWKCYEYDTGSEFGCREIAFEELLHQEHKRQRRNSPNARREEINKGKYVNKEETVKEASNNLPDNQENMNLEGRLNWVTSIIEKGRKRILILLENMEWIANLYDTPTFQWITRMHDPQWKKSEKLMLVVTIQDMKLLEKYNFPENEIFISNPSAEEITLAYWRYIVRNTNDNYVWDFKVLDDIAHSMSVGKKTLLQCIRILHKIIRTQNATELSAEDFVRCAEINIEEKVLWNDIILKRSKKNEIEDAVNNFMSKDDMRGVRKGLLLTGPPGTGKTMLAKALATEKKCYFMAPTLADLKGEYVGETSGKVKRIFAEARANQPTILFIDEADTVFPSRELNAQDRDSYGLDMVNQFLQELDGAKTGTQKIFTIAATNRPMAIDGAIRSRLSGTPIEIPLPDSDARRILFNKRLAPFSLDGKTFLHDVLKKSEGMSGRDIDSMVGAIKEVYDVREMGDNEETHRVFNHAFENREKNFLSESIFKNCAINPNENTKKFDSVIGYEDLKERISRQVKYIIASSSEKKQYLKYGIEPSKGILMYGPPGNAKTLLAEATAGEFGFYFIKIISQDFISSFPDQQIRRLTEIFEGADVFSKMINAPGIVLFFDEFDSLAGTSVLHPSVRGTLLTFIADLKRKDSKILFMAATNFFNRIDEAVKRPGRLDEHLYMDNPTKEDGIKILKTLLKNDSSIVEELSDEAINEIYNNLKIEVQTNPEKRRQLMEDMFGSINVFEMQDTIKQDLLEKKLENLLPSGADIKTKYESLKEIAFINKNMTDDDTPKLKIEYGIERNDNEQ